MAKRSVRKSRHIVMLDEPTSPEESEKVFDLSLKRIEHIKEMVEDVTTKHILILDDQQERHDGFIQMHKGTGARLKHAYTAPEARELLDTYVFDVAFLDHDLEEDGSYYPTAGTGMDVARHIIAMNPEKRPKFVWVHSWNESRALAMEADLRAAGVRCRWKAYRAPSKVG